MSSENRPVVSWRWVWLLGALALLTGGALWLCHLRNAADVENAGLQLDPKCLDTGTVWVQDRFPWTLRVTNPTDRLIEIVDVVASGRCVSVEPRALAVPAGGQSSIQIELDLTAVRTAARAAPIRNFTATLRPVIKDWTQQVGWKIVGKVRSPFVVSPAVLDLGEFSRGAPPPPRTVAIDCHTVLESVTAACDDSMGQVEVVRQDNDPRRCQLRVAPGASLPLGAFEFHVGIRAVEKTAGDIPEIPLLVSGFVIQDVRVLPAIVAFQPAPVGNVLEETLTFCSRSGSAFEMVEVLAEDGSLKVAAIPEDSGNDGPANPRPIRRYRLSQHVSAVGRQSSRVRFVLSKGAAPQRSEIRVPVSYYGLPATDPGKSAPDASGS